MSENKNALLAIVLSIIIIMLFEVLYSGSERDNDLESEITEDASSISETEITKSAENLPIPKIKKSSSGISLKESVPKNRKESARIKINSLKLKGSINLTGMRIDDLQLVEYKNDLDENSPDVTVLFPPNDTNGFFLQTGWVGETNDISLPDKNTQWVSDEDEISSNKSVRLTWDNGKKILFEQNIHLDDNYVFSITQRVVNNSSREIKIFPYGLISRKGTPETLGFFILHEGPVGVLNGQLKEIDYDELKENEKFNEAAKGGWMGFTDKYWLTSFMLPHNRSAEVRAFHTVDEIKEDIYQIDYLLSQKSIKPGQEVETITRFFVGPKSIELLDSYSEEFSIPKFDLAIDFGWFYFLTKPLFYLMKFLYGIIGNYGVVILAITAIIRILLFPLANKQFASMNHMKEVQPEIVKLRERFADDKARLNQEMMKLYKEKKINPAAGCLPIFIQIPIFFALYKVLFVAIEMRQAPFFGWITDLSVPDPTSMFNLFGLLPFTPPDFLSIGVWPLLMGLSMYIQQKLSPTPPDPIQAKVFMFLPIFFTILLANFPSGLVIYWFFNNVLSIAQQSYLMKFSSKEKPQ
ncbi:MAG: membrane protein insertase YidC [Pseudomonadota bacterium]|nr:membrane protein insertase YidC [Pseudomonadota bacterium]MEE3260587.1 membrane protein insertase YidC [Pseudomonadota bacterium]